MLRYTGTREKEEKALPMDSGAPPSRLALCGGGGVSTSRCGPSPPPLTLLEPTRQGLLWWVWFYFNLHVLVYITSGTRVWVFGERVSAFSSRSIHHLHTTRAHSHAQPHQTHSLSVPAHVLGTRACPPPTASQGLSRPFPPPYLTPQSPKETRKIVQNCSLVQKGSCL